MRPDLFIAGMPAPETLYDIYNVDTFNTNINYALYRCTKESCSGGIREEDDYGLDR